MLKAGDVIRSKKSGKFYTVTNVINSAYIEHNESTKPQFAGQYEKISTTVGDWQGFNPSAQDVCKEGLEHKWVDAGFHFTNIVCYHCDKPKPKPLEPVVWGSWRRV